MPVRPIRLLAPLALLFASCGAPVPPASPASEESNPANNVTLLSHEVVLDQGTGFLYSGNAKLNGPFPTDTTSQIHLDLSSDDEPADNPAAARLLASFPKDFPNTAKFHPDGATKGVLSTANGRFEVLGKVNAARTEFSGTWFFDDLEGGAFRIAPRGTIFP